MGFYTPYPIAPRVDLKIQIHEWKNSGYLFPFGSADAALQAVFEMSNIGVDIRVLVLANIDAFEEGARLETDHVPNAEIAGLAILYDQLGSVVEEKQCPIVPAV
jgi:hypothetical protein